MAKITDIEGIGPAMSAKLAEAGVTTTDALLTAGASPAGRKKLCEDSGCTGAQILDWVNMADLMRVKGVGEEYSELLEAAGVDTVKELRNRNAENLTAAMEAKNEEKKLVRRTPSLKEVTGWIDNAKTLDVVLTY
jgi:predicted flap endonuclease-1-like 5' DNA nuclease